MKKIFSLALALIVFGGVANAQQRIIEVNKTDGTTDTYKIPNFENITFGYEEWEEYAVGTYAYHIYWNGTNNSMVTKENLSLCRSSLNPKKFKIEKWGYDTDTDFYFFYDEDVGTVIVVEQEIGDVTSYGMSYVDELSHQSWGTGQYNSRRSGDIFFFSLVYFSDSGYFGYTGDKNNNTYETFTITSK